MSQASPHPGQKLVSLRFDAAGAPDWGRITLGDVLNSRGGTADIFNVAEVTTPPLVAKIYRTSLRSIVASNANEASRLIPLVRNRDNLAAALPFVTWPRRLLFQNHPPTPEKFQEELIGFSMANVGNVTTLTNILERPDDRLGLTPRDTGHLAKLLADQIDQLHRHPFGFVMSDFTPHNVLISGRYDALTFIDVDSFQFTDHSHGKTRRYPFNGYTQGYQSPWKLDPSVDFLPDSHDNFILAMLIFQLSMAELGFLTLHPFQAGNQDPDENVRKRNFPYNDRSQVVDEPYFAYQSLPLEMREAFTQAFVHHQPPSPSRWVSLINHHWRLLRRP